MRDIPCFQTDFGTAGLVLNQIPYTQTAFVHLKDSVDVEGLLTECVQFCVACGAEKVYASGDGCSDRYPAYMQVWELTAPLEAMADTDACIIPVTEQTLDRWLELYHARMLGVAHAAHISQQEGKRMPSEGGGYFVHRDGRLLGIGKAKGDTLECLASTQPGAGEDVVLALCHGLSGDRVRLEVASTNHRAIRLYERLGFIKTNIKRCWYQVL